MNNIDRLFFVMETSVVVRKESEELVFKYNLDELKAWSQ